jgi:hypothetical protein
VRDDTGGGGGEGAVGGGVVRVVRVVSDVGEGVACYDR